MNIVQHIKELEELKIEAAKQASPYYLDKQKKDQNKSPHHHVIDEGKIVPDTSEHKPFDEILKQKINKLDSKTK